MLYFELTLPGAAVISGEQNMMAAIFFFHIAAKIFRGPTIDIASTKGFRIDLTAAGDQNQGHLVLVSQFNRHIDAIETHGTHAQESRLSQLKHVL